MSKERAAKIANSPGASKRGGKASRSSTSRSNSSQGGTTAQKKAAGRKGGRATAPSLDPIGGSHSADDCARYRVLRRERIAQQPKGSSSCQRGYRAPHSPPYVLIVLALCALAGSLVGGSARPAAAAGITAHTSCAPAQPFPQGEMRCFALRRTTGVVAHVPSGDERRRRRQRLRPVRPRQRVQRADTLGSGKTVAIVDAYNDPNAASDLARIAATSACRPARSRTAASSRSTRTARQPAPGEQRRLVVGDHARPRDGLGHLPELSHPARRGQQSRRPRTSARPSTPPSRRAPSPCRTATAAPRARTKRATTPRTTSTPAWRSSPPPATAATRASIQPRRRT